MIRDGSFKTEGMEHDQEGPLAPDDEKKARSRERIHRTRALC